MAHNYFFINIKNDNTQDIQYKLERWQKDTKFHQPVRADEIYCMKRDENNVIIVMTKSKWTNDKFSFTVHILLHLALQTVLDNYNTNVCHKNQEQIDQYIQ